LAQHGALIAGERWVIEGLGTPDSAPARFQRSTEIIFVDLPLWVHFWFAAERQRAWHAGRLDHPPAGEAKAPPTRAVFEAIWMIERNWMPRVRASVRAAERDGCRVTRLVSLEALDAFTASIEA
jgi:hypothetical protein